MFLDCGTDLGSGHLVPGEYCMLRRFVNLPPKSSNCICPDFVTDSYINAFYCEDDAFNC